MFLITPQGCPLPGEEFFLFLLSTSAPGILPQRNIRISLLNIWPLTAALSISSLQPGLSEAKVCNMPWASLNRKMLPAYPPRRENLDWDQQRHTKPTMHRTSLQEVRRVDEPMKPTHFAILAVSA